MAKRYWWILITYVVTFFSIILAKPVLKQTNIPQEQWPAVWLSGSFAIALIIILSLLKKDLKKENWARDRASIDGTILWSFLGVILLFAVQYVAIFIEIILLDIQPGSENTQEIAKMVRSTPYLIMTVAIIGPVIEEIVFRKVIFGSLNKKFSFHMAAVVSALIFGLAHGEIVHLLIYTALGFTLAFLYWKTKRIIVPIIAHVSMNTIVMIAQVMFGEEIRKIQQMQQFIGGFL